MVVVVEECSGSEAMESRVDVPFVVASDCSNELVRVGVSVREGVSGGSPGTSRLCLVPRLWGSWKGGEV